MSYNLINLALCPTILVLVLSAAPFSTGAVLSNVRTSKSESKSSEDEAMELIRRQHRLLQAAKSAPPVTLPPKALQTASASSTRQSATTILQTSTPVIEEPTKKPTGKRCSMLAPGLKKLLGLFYLASGYDIAIGNPYALLQNDWQGFKLNVFDASLLSAAIIPPILSKANGDDIDTDSTVQMQNNIAQSFSIYDDGKACACYSKQIARDDDLQSHIFKTYFINGGPSESHFIESAFKSSSVFQVHHAEPTARPFINQFQCNYSAASFGYDNVTALSELSNLFARDFLAALAKMGSHPDDDYYYKLFIDQYGTHLVSQVVFGYRRGRLYFVADGDLRRFKQRYPRHSEGIIVVNSDEVDSETACLWSTAAEAEFIQRSESFHIGEQETAGEPVAIKLEAWDHVLRIWLPMLAPGARKVNLTRLHDVTRRHCCFNNKVASPTCTDINNLGKPAATGGNNNLSKSTSMPTLEQLYRKCQLVHRPSYCKKVEMELIARKNKAGAKNAIIKQKDGRN